MSEVLEAPAAQTTDITTLPPADRAALVLHSTKNEADLKQLAESLKAITLVNSKAGRDQAHALAMTATKARTYITKVGKAAREDATKFSTAVIAEEKRLIAIISEQEDRVFGLRDAWDAAEAARKEAEAQKERDRIAAHQAVITQINSYPGLAREARTSAMALQLLEKLQAINTFNNCLEEFTEAAHAAKIAATEQLDAIIEAKQTAEAEQARIKAEQEAEAARLAEERKRMEAERAEAARVAAEQQAELLAMQAKMKAQQEELDRQAAAMAQQAAELAARKAEAEKPAEVPAATLAADPRDALAQVMAPAHIDALAQVSHAELEKDVALIQQPATVDEMHAIGEGIRNDPDPVEPTPPVQGLVLAVAEAYDVEPATAIRWLAEHADEFKSMNTLTEVTP